jgi:hypothetical protein
MDHKKPPPLYTCNNKLNKVSPKNGQIFRVKQTACTGFPRLQKSTESNREAHLFLNYYDVFRNLGKKQLYL